MAAAYLALRDRRSAANGLARSGSPPSSLFSRSSSAAFSASGSRPRRWFQLLRRGARHPFRNRHSGADPAGEDRPPARRLVLAAQLALAPERWVVGVAPLGAALFLLAAHVVNPKGMGMGGVRLSSCWGRTRGACGGGVLVGVCGAPPCALSGRRPGRGARGVRIPFGPFLALGGIVTLFWGDALLDAYLGTL